MAKHSVLKKLLLLFILNLFVAFAFCQNNYWQQKVDYKIVVSLNDTDNVLTGYELMNYTNNSPDTLTFIWIHLWPNAYKNDRTAFSDQLLINGRTDFYFSEENKRGYINRLNFKVDKQPAKMEDHSQHQDIVKLILPQPLAPGKSIQIETPFHEKLPYNFSRGGHEGQSFQVTQWYPKPAVYDRKGWHEMPYLDQGEFYSEFGSFDVEITVPQKYVVAATGNLKNETSEEQNKTLHYVQDNVHDFAWFADKDFIVLQDTVQVQDKIIKVNVYHLEDKKGLWNNSVAFTKNAIRTKSALLGVYPYNVVSVVDNAAKVPGGMEYPTITLLKAEGTAQSLDEVINHEVGHNWFYGILATNERMFPWMDEGMNSYYDKIYATANYGNKSDDKKQDFFQKRIPEDMAPVLLATVEKIKKDQPISTPAENFSSINYNLTAYEKTAQWMQLLEKETGTETFNSIMKTYYDRWKFKHPYPEDFKAVVEEVSGKNLDALFALLDKKGAMKPVHKKQIKATSFFNLKETDNYNYISFAPAVGINYYDKLMVGAVIHNYNLPPNNFQFIAVPLYATGTKKFNGIGGVEYNWYPGSKGARAVVSVAAAKFTGGSFTDSLNNKNPLQFTKVVPSLKYVFANKSPLSHVQKYIQWKTFLINETGLSFKRDNVNNIDIISYPKEQRYVNQLQLVYENNRVLYPHKGVLQAEQGDGFVRANFTGNYFFNYPKGGGLNVRFFAGKFFYTGDKSFVNQFKTEQYHLNMSGPKGDEDYTYNNYFIGRNEFDGISSQQIMKRDGFFKVRTDLLSNKIGKTDDWLSAVNFTTDIPDKINPLSMLPFKLPLRIFADIGTYAEAWDKNNTSGRFLYDAGLQLSLFNNVINVYAPIIYSKVYSDYFKSTIIEKRFLKNISFSIDLQNLKSTSFLPALNF